MPLSKTPFEIYKAYKDSLKMNSKKEELDQEAFNYFDCVGYDRGASDLRNDLKKKLSPSSESHAISRIRELYLFGIPVEKYLQTEDLERLQSRFSRKLYFPETIMRLSLISGKKFHDDYKTIVMPYITSGSFSYRAYEYIGKGNRDPKTIGRTLVQYGRVHHLIFQKMEERISQANMNYKRFIALPMRDKIRYKIPTKRQMSDAKLQDYLENMGLTDGGKEYTSEEKNRLHLADFIINGSPQLFSHACRCLERFNSDDVAFYLVHKPRRYYHYGFVDDRTLMIEHYSYDDNNSFMPDLLSIYDLEKQKGENIDTRLDAYSEELEKLESNRYRSFRIYKYNIKAALKTAYGYLKLQYHIITNGIIPLGETLVTKESIEYQQRSLLLKIGLAENILTNPGTNNLINYTDQEKGQMAQELMRFEKYNPSNSKST